MRRYLVLLGWSFASCGICGDPEFGQKELRARRELNLLVAAEGHFLNATGRPAESIEEMAPPGCIGDGCVLAELPRDPWGNAYRSILIAGRPRFFSLGPDRRWGSADDLSAGSIREHTDAG